MLIGVVIEGKKRNFGFSNDGDEGLLVSTCYLSTKAIAFLQ